MTLLIRYDYVSWERLFPGYGVDLTALRYEPPDEHQSGVDAALKHLRLGRNPKPGVLADIRNGLSTALAVVISQNPCYAAVLFPKPKRSADYLAMEFIAYDSTGVKLRPVDMVRPYVSAEEPGVTARYAGLTICGSNASGTTLYAVRSYSTTAALAEVLDDMVDGWIRGLHFPAENQHANPNVRSSPSCGTTRRVRRTGRS